MSAERLGRVVSFDDIQSAHKGCPHCLGTCYLRIQRPGMPLAAPEWCPKAVGDFARKFQHRLVEGPRGDTYWRAGESPEEWSFYLMHMAGRIAQAKSHDLGVDLWVKYGLAQGVPIGAPFLLPEVASA